ncbi:acyl carrier protein [Paenibacillus elgii]|uniref:acyl carrier protein n=1 Tax=Paenibacillus elgii TaxID=189691 RepID=UPI001672F898|nr:acyl carrier protein [Paenibacillus elgii]
MEERKDIRDSVLQILKEIISVDDAINRDDFLGEHGLDSIKAVSLIVSLEEHFDITFDDGELLFENFSSINNIQEMINKKFEDKSF